MVAHGQIPRMAKIRESPQVGVPRSAVEGNPFESYTFTHPALGPFADFCCDRLHPDTGKLDAVKKESALFCKTSYSVF